MSEETTPDQTDPVDATETPDEGTGDFDRERALDKIKKVNSENANLRKRMKALEVFEKQAQEAEQAKLTEAERFAAQIAEATARADAAEKRLLRQSVARKAGLPDDLADRLQGDDEDSLLADAQRLVELFPNKPVRRSDPSQGSDALPLNGDPLLESLKTKLGIS